MTTTPSLAFPCSGGSGKNYAQDIMKVLQQIMTMQKEMLDSMAVL
jgi:hypothetical protein